MIQGIKRRFPDLAKDDHLGYVALEQAMGSAHRRSACRFLSVVFWLEISGLVSRRCLRKYVPLAVVRLAP